MDVYAWADDQRERKRREFYRLLQRGRDIFTPRHIFDRCCVKWLIDGSIQHDEYGGFYDDPFDPPSGCNGGCNRDHPCITLRFDVDTKSTIAHLSHRLDPFVQCMNGLVEEGKGWPQSASEYQINGYLRANKTLLRSHDGFGSHLVKVEDAEVDASDAAQAAELEEQEANSRAAKRPRKTEEGDDGGLTVEDLSRAAMDVVMKHRLWIDLRDDPLTLFCLTQVSESFKKFADSVAAAKVKTLDLTATPLVNGMQRFGDSKFDGYDPETFDSEGFGLEDAYIVEYTKRDKISLDFQPSETGGDGGYEPTNADTAIFSWDTGKLDRYSDDEHTRDYDDASHSEYAYCGQKLRVYWHPTDSDPVKPPKNSDFYGVQKPSLGFRVAAFSLINYSTTLGRYQQPDIGIVTKSHHGVTIRFEVLESNTSETEEVDDEEEVSEYETDEEAEYGQRRVVKIVEKMGHYIQYSGKIKLVDVKVDFSVIVRLHADEVKRELDRKYSRILRERPLTTTESEYQRFVKFASRQGI